MNFFEAIKTCFSKYTDFNGRARRSEHWYFFLFVHLVSLLLGIMFFVAFFPVIVEMGQKSDKINDSDILSMLGKIFLSPWLIASLIFSLATFIPILSVQVRRMHDTNRPGAWVMVYWGGWLANCVIPFLGPLLYLGGCIWFLILACEDSAPGENEFGPNPKGIDGYNYEL